MAADIGLRLQRDLRLSEDQRLQVAPIVETFVHEIESLCANAIVESLLAETALAAHQDPAPAGVGNGIDRGLRRRAARGCDLPLLWAQGGCAIQLSAAKRGESGGGSV